MDKLNPIKNKVFENWARIYSCRPELYFEPESIDQLREILKLADANDKKVKVVGVGHSPSSIACTEDYMVSLRKFNKLIDIDGKNNQIKVEAGMRIDAINELLEKNNMALSVLGSIGDQTIAGAISVAFHGTGIEFNVLSAYVLEVDMMLASGEIKTYSATSNSDVFKAVLCSLGCLGVMVSVKLQCEPCFRLEQIEYGAKLDDVLQSLDVYVKSSDHFRMLWYPHTDYVICYGAKRTDKPLRPKQFSWIKDRLIGYYLLEFLFWIGIYFSFIIPVINYLYYKLYADRKVSVNVSYKQFIFDCLFKQHVFESAIPIKETSHYLLSLKSWLENNPDVKVHFGVEIRFTKQDDIWLSPCYEQDSCYLNILMFRPYGKEHPREKWWDINQKLMMECNGRPHWAKTLNLKKKDFIKLYPKFEEFMDLRKRLDPKDMFMNHCLESIFYS